MKNYLFHLVMLLVLSILPVCISFADVAAVEETTPPPAEGPITPDQIPPLTVEGSASQPMPSVSPPAQQPAGMNPAAQAPTAQPPVQQPTVVQPAVQAPMPAPAAQPLAPPTPTSVNPSPLPQ